MMTTSRTDSPAAQVRINLLVLESDIFLDQSGLSSEVDDEIGCPVYSENRGVDAEVIVRRRSPVAESEEIVVGLPGPVLSSDSGASLLRADSQSFGNPFHTLLQRRADEDIQAFRVPEDVVGAPAYENRRTFRRDVPDDLALDFEKLIVTDVVLCAAEPSGPEE